MRGRVVIALAWVLAAAGCGRSLPETHYYALVAPSPSPSTGGSSRAARAGADGRGDPNAAADPHTHPTAGAGASSAAHGGADAHGNARGERPALRIEELRVDAAYDDPRIVYRTSPYRIGYYHYHRWTAAPGELVADTLRSGYAATGRFRRVERSLDDAAVALSGRIVAIEEVDRSRTEWLGRLVLELELRDVSSGETVWSARFDERAPLEQQSPEGLARALSGIVDRIVRRTAPALAELARAARDGG